MNKRQLFLQTLCIGTVNVIITLIGLAWVKSSGNLLIYILIAVILFVVPAGILYLGNRVTDQMLREIIQVLSRFNNGDFTARIRLKTKSREFIAVKEQFESLRDMLNTWIYELLYSAVDVKMSAEKINEGTKRTTEGIEELNINLNEISMFFSETNSMISDVSEAAIHLSANGADIAQRSIDTVESIRLANDAAQAGGASLAQVTASMEVMQSHVTDVYEKMVHLDQVSQQIGSITDTIASVSKQTNLLALNASIESARAGEAGKGFAVVADEVHMLSDKTKVAANRINDLVNSIQNEIQQAVNSMKAVNVEVQEGVEVTAHTYDKLKHIISVTGETLLFIEKISGDSKEQAKKTDIISSNAQEVTEKSHSGTASVQEISCVMENQAEDIRNTNDTTYELLKVAHNLETVMEGFDKTLGDEMLKVCLQIDETLTVYQQKNNVISEEDLLALTRKYGLSEIHLINKEGIIYKTTNSDCLNFQFSDKEGTQTYEFTQILKNPSLKVNQKSAFRDVDGKLFKYAGLSMAGNSGIIQCGLDASKLTEFIGV